MLEIFEIFWIKSVKNETKIELGNLQGVTKQQK